MVSKFGEIEFLFISVGPMPTLFFVWVFGTVTVIRF